MEKLMMFCAGYPSEANPQKGIFTHRTAKILQNHFDIEVILISAFNFKRPFIITYSYEGIRVVQLAIPQFPHFKKGFLMALNSILLTFGMRLLLGSSRLKAAHYYHSTMLVPTSMAVQPLATSFNKLHIGQAIGDDVNFYLTRVLAFAKMKKRLQSIDYFQCNSNALSKSVTAYLPENEKKVFVLYRGIDTELFSPINSEKDQWTQVRLLFLGGMQTFNEEEFEQLNTKGGHILMKAWEEIEKKQGEIQLTFGGPGSDHAYVKEWRDKLLAPDRVSIIGIVQPSMVVELLRSHNLVIIPSLSEGLPNLANEAQSTGVPVIGSNAGGIPETISDGKTGLLFEKGDPKGLVDAIEKLIDNLELREDMGRAGREKMISQFTWSHFAAQLKEKYEYIK